MQVAPDSAFTPLSLLLVTPQVLSLGCPFQGVVVQKLLDQVHVRHEHAAAAVAAEANGVQRLTVGVWGRCGGYGKHVMGPNYAAHTRTQDRGSVHAACVWRKLLEYILQPRN